MKKSYDLKHIVSFEETNLVGNVYYVNHIRWQGKCREMFIYDNARSIVAEIEKGNLALVTLNCYCEYFDEIRVFDEIIIKMFLDKIIQNKITMLFEYYKNEQLGVKLIAKGRQEIACMYRAQGEFTPTAIPEKLRDSLSKFMI